METVMGRIRDKGDVIIAVSIVFVILIMLVPLTPFLADMFLTTSISISLVILFVGMYIRRPIDFSVFPSVLLITTLFRLSLNIASTRLILLHGDEGSHAAGKVIKAFGTFIVGGNYVVGCVVFLILVIINFVVITKGAGRVAEVAARFTLDAMPGKQMSIDADLNAGLIDDVMARKRRENIEIEADFYGAMDGASKFVRGDAIAGIVIIFVCILGGFAIGVLQKGMAMSEALGNYTILTIGEGLVSQIPALLTSTAAGIIVTRAASEYNLGRDMLTQLFTQPKAIMLASVIILSLGLIPGMPLMPFMALSSVTFAASYAINKAKKEQLPAVAAQQPEGKEKEEVVQPVEVLELEIGYGLIPMVDAEQGGELLDKIRAIRKQMAMELGIVVPPMKLKDNLQLRASEYVIHLRGIEVGRGDLLAGHVLAMSPEGNEKQVDGIPTKEPVFNLEAYWVKEKDRERYVAEGLTIVDHPTIIATHLTEIVRNNAHEILTRRDTQKLVDSISSTHQKVVEEINQNQVSMGTIQKVLQNLLREQVSIRDLATILETIADSCGTIKDPDIITEYVRQRMARSILKPYLVGGVLNIVLLEKSLEEKVISRLQASDQGGILALDLAFGQKLVEKVGEEVKKAMLKGLQPIVLVHPIIRGKLRRFLERHIQGITVISHNEIPPQIKIQSIGMVRINEQ
ncbi:MAG: flagellar biosynthesis protein FlhA [Syntrophorhabdales bacterium]|jgi:flagellar biosynthesis protein FlhA